MESVQGYSVFQCTKARDHIKLQSVKDGDKRSKFMKPLDQHVFQTTSSK